MKIGSYDQKIAFFTEGKTSDGLGGYVVAKTTVLETFASVEQLTQKRDLEQAQLSFPAIFRVKIMYRNIFKPEVKHRVSWMGKNFNIISAPQLDNVRRPLEWVFDIKE